MNEAWQSVVSLKGTSGNTGLGLGLQSVLWSDSNVFCSCPEATGNNMMFLLTSYAAKLATGIKWNSPMELQEKILPEVYAYAQKITGIRNLRLTFVLNALVPLDNAAWVLYARESGMKSFDDMLPPDMREGLSCRHGRLSMFPLITYNIPVAKVVDEANQGYPILKIKIGADPENDGDPAKMLEWDKRRLSEIHEAVGNMENQYTDSGHVMYYLDANGRYDNKERILSFLSYAEKIGASGRIILLEEPFSEENKVDVSDIPVRLASDESAHSEEDVRERISLGYRAIALKPIAKTMSASLKMLKVAHESGIPCFCADLTVNPVLLEWNKNFAARMAPLPGLKIGVVESNGHQNYRNWERMKSYHPFAGAGWASPRNGIFHLDSDFYEKSGGILDESRHFAEIAAK